ncbi:MAG: hypothetical protein NT087_02315 [Deltaproteobacteria bacterium]|nr:hypothetical protein [Deltaproteobacteria bacterium]
MAELQHGCRRNAYSSPGEERKANKQQFPTAEHAGTGVLAVYPGKRHAGRKSRNMERSGGLELFLPPGCH